MIIKGSSPLNVTTSTERNINGVEVGSELTVQKQTFRIKGKDYGVMKLAERHTTGILHILSNIKNQTLNDKNAYGEFKGNSEYQLQFTEIDCPKGFKDDVLYYRQNLGHGQDCLFNKIEYKILSGGNIVGIMRQYLIMKEGTSDFKYSYDALNFKGINYYIYPVAKEHNFYYCIYQESKLLAIMDIPRVGVVFSDYCSIYAGDDIDKDLLCLVAGIICNDEELKLPLHQSSLNDDKFDSNFIDEILKVEFK